MPRLITPVALLSATIFSFACDGGGGSDALTLAEYFAAYESLEERGNAEFDELWNQYGIEPGEEATPNPTFNAAYSSIQLTYMDELAKLEPPREVSEAHEQLVEAGRDLAHAIDEGDPDYLDLNTRTYGALCDIYTAADEAGIEHDFSDDFYCGPDAPVFGGVQTPEPS